MDRLSLALFREWPRAMEALLVCEDAGMRPYTCEFRPEGVYVQGEVPFGFNRDRFAELTGTEFCPIETDKAHGGFNIFRADGLRICADIRTPKLAAGGAA